MTSMNVIPNKVTEEDETRPNPAKEEQKPVESTVHAANNRKMSGLPPLKIDAPTSGAEYSACFYKKSNQLYGSKAPEGGLVPPRHGLSNRFTKALNCGGPTRNNSLNTCVEKPRFMEGTTDWMLKIP